MHLDTARQQMIYHQIRPWDVLDPRVLTALATTPRERFVPEKYRELAFADVAIPLPCGQYMLKPVMEGRLLQYLDVQEDNRVLVVGTGSGFITACVAQLADQVVSVDIHGELVETAAQKFADEHIRNVELDVQDYRKLDAVAGFDRILVTGSMPLFDERLPEWLKPGGRLVLIVGEAPAMEVERITRADSSYTRETLFETVVPQLENVPLPEEFHF
jgi:protein-L-isoaspartate(D-aspartate) O-methyltransferase